MATLSRFEFLEDAAAYHAMQARWQATFDTILTPHQLTHLPYFRSDFREGEPYSNGNPIFTAYIDASKRGVRIIQDIQVEDAERYISGWLDRVEGFDGLPELDELVIALLLSEETKAIAEALIRAWLVEQVDKVSMDKLLEEKAILAAE